MNRWAIYRNGYVEESGDIIEPRFITDAYSKEAAEREMYLRLKSKEELYDYFAVQEEKFYDDWVGIENTEFSLEPNKKVTCTINFLQEHTYNRDLDSQIHKGFTIKKGWRLYFMMLWHGRTTGNVTVFPVTNGSGRYIQGDTEITIHWKY